MLINTLSFEYLLIALLILGINILIMWDFLVVTKIREKERKMHKKTNTSYFLTFIIAILGYVLIFIMTVGYRSPVKSVDVGAKNTKIEVKQYVEKNIVSNEKQNEISEKKSLNKKQEQNKKIEQIQKKSLNNFKNFLEEINE